MPAISRRSLFALGAAGAVAGVRARRALAPDWSAKLGRTPNTRFALNAEIWFGDLPFLDRVRKAADLGYPAVEFWPWRGKDLPALAKLLAETKLEVAQFTAWGFTPG